MAGVTFSHPNSSLGTLSLRLAPTNVDWSYELKKSVTQTYAGEVVQILGLNFGKFVIEGKFGKEGPHGHILDNGRLHERSITGYDDWRTTQPYGVGLTQMTAYFRQYFSLASQGLGDSAPDKNYDERPMTVKYSGASPIAVDTDKQDSVWKVYPISFPSYMRSNENFAPSWKVECEVAEAPGHIQKGEFDAALKRLRAGVGYTPSNPYSDPFAWRLRADPHSTITPEQYKRNREMAIKTTLSYLDHYSELLGNPTAADLEELIFAGGSIPRIYGEILEAQASGTDGK